MQLSQRQLEYGPYRVQGDPERGDAPYIIAGRHMYALGYGSTRIAPIGAEHLIGLMGGIWAHPARVADGLELCLRNEREAALPTDQVRMREQLDAVQWDWHSADLHVVRRDAIVTDAAVYCMQSELTNNGSQPQAGSLVVRASLGFLGCWFGGISCGEAIYRQSNQLIIGQDGLRPEWGIALGAPEMPDAVQISPNPQGAVVELVYRFQLQPGKHWHKRILLAVGLQNGAAEAIDEWQRHSAERPTAPQASTRPILHSEADALARHSALAQANLALLQADYPDLGAYFLAGLPEYPQLFGCDTTYSIPGAVAAGFGDTAGSALERLAEYAGRACGRIPHEITTNGRVFNPGNIQETPQFTIAVWDYLRWSGDQERARRLFPICREGMTELIAAHSLAGQPFYPLGDGMVERMGMGSRKLDSACYTIAALQALAELANALGEPDAAHYRARAAEATAAFERDWWLEDEGLYADSMHSDGSLQLDGHWTIVLPVQLGLAEAERANRVMQRLERDFVNQWGLVHTRNVDERVWTLPTGLMALAAFRMGRAERGLALTTAIAQTSEHGGLGYFKELIPQGLCFIQLWSAALYLQAIYEGLLGLAPDAMAHSLQITPCMPTSFPAVQIERMQIGAHLLNLTISPQALSIEHLNGPQALAISYNGTGYELVPGATLACECQPKGGSP